MVVNINKLKEKVYELKQNIDKNIIAVVKSNAYNLGSRYIIKYLKEAGVSFFAFNKYIEYIECSDLLLNDKVLIFESLKKDIIKTLPDNVRITINSVSDIYEVDNFRKVHVQIDTSMNRMGIKKVSELDEILLKDNVVFEGIYTHFVSKDKYKKQVKLFNKYVGKHNFSIIHTSSSNYLNKNIIGNYIRIGMNLYKNIVKVYTSLNNIRYLKKGECVGYNSLFKAKKTCYIGVIDIGYYEGMKEGVVKYYNQYYHVIGKICMNHSFILLDKPIKNSSLLNIFPINDKIYKKDKYSMYERLVSYRNFKRIYITEYKHDLRKISKSCLKKSYNIRQRTRSD